MSSTTVSVKRNKHRVHPCKHEQKHELLNFLISSNTEKSILVVTANDPEDIQKMISDEDTIVISDTALGDSPELQCDLLISYDLPETAIAYMVRLSRAKTDALILLDPKEHKSLYAIERLLGRTIMQEMISGLESDTVETQKQEKKTDKWAKKEREPSRYIGKDENGKPIFSGKTRERNHRYDGKPKEDTAKASRKRNERNDNQEKKPFKNSKSYSDKMQGKPYDNGSKNKSRSKGKSSQNTVQESAPKRPPRKIKVKSLNPSKESE